jgi:hypothetical protein
MPYQVGQAAKTEELEKKLAEQPKLAPAPQPQSPPVPGANAEPVPAPAPPVPA